MDAWAAKHLGTPCDTGGAWAASGRVVAALLETMLADPYFALRAPKSTGRDHFNFAWIKSHSLAGLAPKDVQATLAELTARSIVHAVKASNANELWLCGGGAHNSELLRRIAAHLPDWQNRRWLIRAAISRRSPAQGRHACSGRSIPAKKPFKFLCSPFSPITRSHSDCADFTPLPPNRTYTVTRQS